MSFKIPKYLQDYLSNTKYRKPYINFTNNSTFYSQLNYQWQNYMQTVVRPCIAYATGSVDGIYNNSLSASTGMAIKNGAVKLLVGDKTFFVGDDTSCKFLSDVWAQKQNFTRFLLKAFSYMLEGGTAVIKSNKNSRDWNTLSAHRIDRTMISTDENGEIISAVFFISLLSKMENTAETTYWLTEERKYNENEKKVVCYKVFVKSGLENSPTLPSPLSRGISFERLPANIKREVKKFGITELNNERPLSTHDGLGVWLIQRTATNSCIPDVAFGDPLLYGCLDLLWSVDVVFSGSIVDVLNGEGKILVPKMFLQETLQRLGQQYPTTNFNVSTEELGRYDSENFVYIMPSGFDKDKQAPLPIQFEIRAEQYGKMWELYERAACVRAGFAPTSIFPYLTPDNSAKTAREVTAEENLTRATIRDIHTQTNAVFNRCIQEILYQEGFSMDVQLQFSDYIGNKLEFDANIRQNLASGVIPQEMAVKQINNLTDSETADYLNKIDSDKKKEQQYQQIDMGDLLNVGKNNA